MVAARTGSQLSAAVDGAGHKDGWPGHVEPGERGRRAKARALPAGLQRHRLVVRGLDGDDLANDRAAAGTPDHLRSVEVGWLPEGSALPARGRRRAIPDGRWVGQCNRHGEPGHPPSGQTRHDGRRDDHQDQHAEAGQAVIHSLR